MTSRAPLLAVLAVACSSPFSVSERLEVANQYAKWRSLGLASYVYETRSICFCDPDHGQWAMVFVTDGVVGEVRLDDGRVMPASRLGEWSTVDEIFRGLLAISDQGHLDDVSVTFDDRYHYPAAIAFLTDRALVDGGSTELLRALVPR